MRSYQLALDLYDTGIYDAQYLAGLIADETRMTKQDLRRWLAKANCNLLSGTVVAWVAAESRHGRFLANFQTGQAGGKVAETKEVRKGIVFADYDESGNLLGIEQLGPSPLSVLEKLTRNDPPSRQFVRRTVPHEMAVR